MIDSAVGEVGRELMVRGAIYPRLVAQGKLTHEEAHRRTSLLEWAHMLLYVLSKNPSLLVQVEDLVEVEACRPASTGPRPTTVQKRD